jgi:hypothetical protein
MDESRPQPTPDRVTFLTKRAAKAGYRLTPDASQPGGWLLLDAEDGVRIHSVADLDAIERWLNS